MIAGACDIASGTTGEHAEHGGDVARELLAVFGQGDLPVLAGSQERSAGGVFELADLAVQGGALDADLAGGLKEVSLPGKREYPADALLGAGPGKGRFTTGLAAELHGTGVSVNALGTSGLVMTPGVAVVSPHTPDNAPVEPDEAMADAAVLICGASPAAMTGRIVYSMELLGRPFPDGPWALSMTF